jgi:hypothetical protein
MTVSSTFTSNRATCRSRGAAPSSIATLSSVISSSGEFACTLSLQMLENIHLCFKTFP